MTRKKLIILIIVIIGLLMIVFLIKSKGNREDEFKTPTVAQPENTAIEEDIENEIYEELLNETETNLEDTELNY